MNYMASHDTFCVANSNWVPFLWRPVPDQEIMLLKLMKSCHGEGTIPCTLYSICCLTSQETTRTRG